MTTKETMRLYAAYKAVVSALDEIGAIKGKDSNIDEVQQSLYGVEQTLYDYIGRDN